MLSVLPIDAVNNKLTLTVAADRLVFNGEDFLLDEIDQVAWSEQGLRINNAYQGRMFHLDVKAGVRHGRFLMPGGGHKDTRVPECRAWYDPTVALLQESVVPRLFARTVARIGEGETVKYPPTASADRTGIRAGMLFKKHLPWDRIVGTDLFAGGVWVLVDRPGKEPKRQVALDQQTYNLAVLKQLISHFNPAGTVGR